MKSIEMQMEIKTQNAVLASCFTDCAQSFRDDALSAGEKSCLQNCTLRSFGTIELFTGITQ